MFGLLFTALVSLGASGGDEPICIDSQRQLFLDDHLIAWMANVTRQVHVARKYEGNPVLRSSEDWEGKVAVIYGSVIREDGRYRMWYYSGTGVGYAESRDGLEWEKPTFDFVTANGQKTNVIIPHQAAKGQGNSLEYFYEIFGVHRDDREADPARRYKMGFLSLDREYKGPRGQRFHAGQRRGLGVAGSPDGIHWTLIDNWTTEAICDGDTHWMFDPKSKRYVLYGRTKYVSPEVEAAWSGDAWVKRHFWGRSVVRVDSADFLDWNITAPAEGPVVMTADVKDAPGTEIYSMLVFPYESVYIGLVQIFRNQEAGTILEIQLAVSRDSVNFERVGNREPFLPVGPVGSWDRFNNSLANNPPIREGDELRFYYGGRASRHGPYDGRDSGPPAGSIGVATIRRDRFVSLSASYDGGTILTKPVRLAGRTLHVNGRANFGEILIDLVDVEGTIVATGKPFMADSLDGRIEWERGDVKDLESTVRMKITLRNAHLFAFWCE